MVETDQSRYQVSLLWESGSTLYLAAYTLDGDEIVRRRVPAHLAADALRHSSIFLDLH